MHGPLEIFALLAFTATATGLLIAGVIVATLAVDRRAAARRPRRHGETPASGRTNRLTAERRAERAGLRR